MNKIEERFISIEEKYGLNMQKQKEKEVPVFGAFC
jgi:hypothetical protein